ncbi:MAG: hypothetical protein ACT4OS_12645 [Acidimicrobiales bacterium]
MADPVASSPVALGRCRTDPVTTTGPRPRRADVRGIPLGPADLVIDCRECLMRKSAACEDCVVSYICTEPDVTPGSAVVIDPADLGAMRLMAEAGMVPDLRLQLWRRPQRIHQ